MERLVDYLLNIWLYYPESLMRISLSIGVILLSVLVNKVLARFYQKNVSESVDARRMAYVSARNVVVGTTLVALLFLWGGELRTFALSLAALAAAFAIACKELIMSALGYFFRVVQRLYNVGDTIEIQHYCGEVVEINFLTTVLMHHGHSGQITGDYIEFPNMILLTNPLKKSARRGATYTLSQVRVALDPHTTDVGVHYEHLQKAANDICQEWIEGADAHFRGLERKFMIEWPEGCPVILIEPVSEKRVDLVVRFPCFSSRKMRTGQDILRQYYYLAGSRPMCQVENN